MRARCPCGVCLVGWPGLPANGAPPHAACRGFATSQPVTPPPSSKAGRKGRTCVEPRLQRALLAIVQRFTIAALQRQPHGEAGGCGARRHHRPPLGLCFTARGRQCVGRLPALTPCCCSTHVVEMLVPAGPLPVQLLVLCPAAAAGLAPDVAVVAVGCWGGAHGGGGCCARPARRPFQWLGWLRRAWGFGCCSANTRSCCGAAAASAYNPSGGKQGNAGRCLAVRVGDCVQGPCTLKNKASACTAYAMYMRRLPFSAHTMIHDCTGMYTVDGCACDETMKACRA